MAVRVNFFTSRHSLAVYPTKQTTSEPVGTSQKCQELKR